MSFDAVMALTFDTGDTRLGGHAGFSTALAEADGCDIVKITGIIEHTEDWRSA